MKWEEWKNEFDTLARQRGLNPSSLPLDYQQAMCLNWDWAPADAVDCMQEFAELQEHAVRDRKPLEELIHPLRGG